MKCVIVSSLAIHKYKRMDAAFFCGELGREAQAEIDRRNANIAFEQQKIAEAQALKSHIDKQHQSMIEAGEIKPIA